MPADRLLNTLLHLYQDVHDDPKSEQIIGTTTHLLSRLGNPLNVAVLTSQLLTAPAIWHRSGFDLSHALRIVSIYNTAALRVRQDAAEALEKKQQQQQQHGTPPSLFPLASRKDESGGRLNPDEWATAVAKGADDRSHRWQHLLVLTGVLVGFESNDRRTLSRGLRDTLEHAVVTAANLALRSSAQDEPLVGIALAMALNYAFPLLSGRRRAQLDCNALLPVLLHAVLHDGYGDGLFLHDVTRDVAQAGEEGNGAGAGAAVSWSPQSPSFALLIEMDRRPVMSNTGPLARMAAFAVTHALDTDVVLQAQDDLLLFSHRLFAAWAGNRLSAIEPALQAVQLSSETQQVTWPALWQVLKKMLFGVVATLQAVVSRGLLDRRMHHDALAVKSLQILRNLYFISSVDSNSAFEVYTFTYLTSLDLLCRNGAACEKFLVHLGPPSPSPLQSSSHLQRTLHLYYLNVAEHMPLSLTTEAADALLVKPAMAYLDSFDDHGGIFVITPIMTQLFESAHSAVLSVLSSPQHGVLTARLAAPYITRLFASFPDRMSSRQFRVAFKTAVQMVSPPFPTAGRDPLLGETLLEMLLDHIPRASSLSLSSSSSSLVEGMVPQLQPPPQSTLVLALIDALPFLPLPILDEWMTTAARAIHALPPDAALRRPVRDRFLEMLVSGEMDVERSALGVAWWGTRGGRELVLFDGDNGEVPMMSGAIMAEESKL